VISIRIAWLLAAVILAGCGAEAPPVIEGRPTLLPASTSIVLEHRTLEPTIAPTPLPSPSPTMDPGINDLPDYYGGLVVTLDYAGQTITMRRGTGFLLMLGQSYAWQVSIDPPEILTPNMKITPEPGEQGVFIAREPGDATLTAIGEPLCLKEDPPCARPNLLFTLNLIIK
jgi:hypothetical protein